jgi:hypothetical protein
MRITPIAAAAVLALTVSGCAAETTELPDTPDVVTETPDTGVDNGDAATDNGSEPDASDNAQSINVDLDPYQPEQLLLAVENSIALAAEQGYVEQYSFPETPESKETVLFDADKPIQEAAALDLGIGFAVPGNAQSLDEALGGLVELRGEATSMIDIIEVGAEEGAQYVNIITNDGFIFNGTTSGNRFYVKTNADGIITSFTQTIGDGERSHEFTYGLTDIQRDLITEAYNMEFEEGIPEE